MGPAPALVGPRRSAFVRAARTMGDHRLSRLFGVGVTTARRWRLRLVGPRAPLPANPDGLTARERRIVAACWGHVPPGALAEALGRCQRTVSALARRELGLGAWTPRASHRKRTPAREQEYLARVAGGERPIKAVDRAMGWSAKTGWKVRREGRAAPALHPRRPPAPSVSPVAARGAASIVLWKRCPTCGGMVLGRGACARGCGTLAAKTAGVR